MDKKIDEKMYKETRVKLINPIYAIGLSWFIYALILPLYRFTDLLIAAAVSVLAYMAARRFIPERTVIAPLTDKGSLDTRCMEIIEEGRAYTEKLTKIQSTIKDPLMKEQVGEIVFISRQMFDYTAKNPRIATDLRNFTEYYYPTTLKLLNTYSDMGNQDAKTQNVDNIMDKVSSVMGTITTAFHKQLDDMYAEKRLDVKTDIQVLQSVLAAEGLAATGKTTLE